MSEQGLTVQLQAILDDYSKEVKEAAAEAIADVSKQAVRELKDKSPSDSGEYARGWRSKKDGDLSAVIYNGTRPSLTYLLENGHTVANQYGNYGNPQGRVAAQKHIEKVEKWANEELAREIERRLE